MNSIPEQQNTDKYLDYLCAQRYAYTKAKMVFQLRIGLSVTFALLGPVIILNFEALKLYVSITAIFYTLIDFLLLRRVENAYREDGAKIQELFDTGLFKLDWNDIVVGERPDSETVFAYSQKFKVKNSLDTLRDWYSPEILSLEFKGAVLVCQRTNIWWDVSLRQKIFWVALITLLLVAFLVFIIFSNDSIILFSILITLLPLFELVGDYVRSQQSSIKSIKSLKSRLDGLIECFANDHNVSNFDLRIAQDEIYRHRSTCLFVPDWFYFLFRDNQEKEMNYSAEHYIDMLSEL